MSDVSAVGWDSEAYPGILISRGGAEGRLKPGELGWGGDGVPVRFVSFVVKKI
ncbi:MAG: hypothetical protein FWC38_03350 [Proteobacteria bacterium]|nr:hypothetical protein [Pseudomonadota bacterium]